MVLRADKKDKSSTNKIVQLLAITAGEAVATVVILAAVLIEAKCSHNTLPIIIFKVSFNASYALSLAVCSCA